MSRLVEIKFPPANKVAARRGDPGEARIDHGTSRAEATNGRICLNCVRVCVLLSEKQMNDYVSAQFFRLNPLRLSGAGGAGAVYCERFRLPD